ncbi:phage tail tube protein [Oerskovia jenensis]|uniref:phage tail tube protein n=1 Tax=Oerskovia jenensis TaxID=162169 RepID=UPI0036D8F8D4
MNTPLNPTVNSIWRLDVDLTPQAPEFIQVRGMQNFVPGINSTVQDSSDYDAEGWGSDAVTMRKAQPTATLLRKENPTTGAYDPGQEALRQASEDLELVHIRWYERKAGGQAWEGYSLVQWAPSGGSTEGLQAVAVTLLVQGKPAKIANPTAATTAPALTSALPSGAAAGAQVTIKGTNLAGTTGAAGVKFGAANASSYVVVDAATIVAVLPAGSAGSAPVVVTNGVGASAPLPYTRGA